VLEMGGKDATIVMKKRCDAAVEGVALAAFGYQGQKMFCMFACDCFGKSV